MCKACRCTRSRTAWSNSGADERDLVFTAPEGGVSRNTNFRPRFFDLPLRRPGCPGLTPHELRHTAASLAVAAGANVKAVQQMLGHASAAMTLDVYAGLFADDLDRVADQLDQAFTKLNADQMRTAARGQAAG
jgi:integrase